MKQRHTYAALISPLLSHCPDLSPSSAKKNTQKTQFSPHSPIFRINLFKRSFSSPFWRRKKVARHGVQGELCCGSSEITPLVQPSRMKLPFDRSIEIKFYFHCQCYFSHHPHNPKINALLCFFHHHRFFVSLVFQIKTWVEFGGGWISSLGMLPLCVQQLEGWGI